LRSLLKQAGAAIIVALFVTSLVAIAAIAMITRLRFDIHRTELLLNDAQAKYYAKGSLDWAIEQLNDNLKNSQSQPNKLVDHTPIHSPKNMMNGMMISSTIYDAQGRFNLNNLTDPKMQPILIKLIQLIDPKISAAAAQNIAAAVTDWISVTTSSSALNDYYIKLKPPYRAPHHKMTSVSELRLVKGITPEIYAALSHYVTALPDATMINVNNTSAPVMASISPSMSLETAKMVVAHCRATPFTDMPQFQNFDVIKNNPIPADRITLLSSYFLVRTNVTVKQQVYTLYTLLQRGGTVAQPNVAIVWQSKGTL
jgi:general secretion pathway protein K